MKTLYSTLSFLFVILISCSSPTDSGMTKKKTITSKVISESNATTSNQTDDEESKTDVEVIIPKEQIKRAKEIISGISIAELALLDGKSLFKSNCSICHGIKGNMKINGAKDLTKIETTLVRSVAQVYFGRKLMTPFKGKLTDAEIVATAQYANSLSEK